MKQYEDLSTDAKEVINLMVEYCINNGLCMGMDEGCDWDTLVRHPFRTELEEFIKEE